VQKNELKFVVGINIISNPFSLYYEETFSKFNLIKRGGVCLMRYKNFGKALAEKKV